MVKGVFPQNPHKVVILSGAPDRFIHDTALGRGVEGPRQCVSYPCCSELFNHRSPRTRSPRTMTETAQTWLLKNSSPTLDVIPKPYYCGSKSHTAGYAQCVLLIEQF